MAGHRIILIVFIYFFFSYELVVISVRCNYIEWHCSVRFSFVKLIPSIFFFFSDYTLGFIFNIFFPQSTSSVLLDVIISIVHFFFMLIPRLFMIIIIDLLE